MYVVTGTGSASIDDLFRMEAARRKRWCVGRGIFYCSLTAYYMWTQYAICTLWQLRIAYCFIFGFKTCSSSDHYICNLSGRAEISCQHMALFGSIGRFFSIVFCWGSNALDYCGGDRFWSTTIYNLVKNFPN
ncbi:hypothetical protein D3C71_904290 [compost metagenome]